MSAKRDTEREEPSWTSERVCGLIIELCRGSGAFGATPGSIERQLNWRRRFLQHDPEGWTYLVAWSCAQAGSGPALRMLIEERGWPRRGVETGWRRAAAAIAAGLVREAGHNAAAIAAADASEDRLAASGAIIPLMGGGPLYRRRRGRRRAETPQGAPVA